MKVIVIPLLMSRVGIIVFGYSWDFAKIYVGKITTVINLNKRGGKNGVFQGLAGLLRGII